MEPVQIDDVFGYIDRRGGPLMVAEVELGLASGQHMTVRAGGGVVTSSPLDPPFTHYEVWLDHDAPRFWRKYSDAEQLVFAGVPRLLVMHHITRSGGIVSAVTMTSFTPPVQRTAVKLPITTMDELTKVLSDLAGRPVSANVLKWP